MSTRPPAPRARHAFPRAAVAMILLSRGGRHSLRWARRTFDFSSAWTTAVVAGVLGLGLTFLLFAFAPPPEAAVNATSTAAQTAAATATTSAAPAPAIPPSDLELELQRTYLPFGWDPDEPAPVVESMTPPPLRQSQAFVLLPRDDWQAAMIRPAVAASSAAGPYYLRAPRVDADVAAAALEAADVPPNEFGPAPRRNIAIAVERVKFTDGVVGNDSGYSLIVHNHGQEAVERVTVRDSVPHIEHVIDVVPPAAVAPDGTLVWSLENLGPGAEMRLTVTLQSAGDRIESAASIYVAAGFGVSTRVAQLDRPPPFTPTFDEPELVLPEPAVLNGNVAASGAIPFDDELPESSAAMPAPADQPGTGASGPDAVIPESVVPATAVPAAAETFEDELPGGNAGAPGTNPIAPPAAGESPLPAADVPAASTAFDDVIPEPSFSPPADPSASRPETSGAAPFDPFATNPAEPDAVRTTTSDSDPPANGSVLPFEDAVPAETAPPAKADSTEEPAWAPRTLPMNEFQSPPRPVLNAKAVSPGSARRGEIVTAYYDITNTGNAPADDVVLTVHLPAELLHKHGETVEHRIERLEPGESRRARLLVRARSTGTARLNATLSHGDQDDEQTTVSIRVVGQSAAPRR